MRGLIEIEASQTAFHRDAYKGIAKPSCPSQMLDGWQVDQVIGHLTELGWIRPELVCDHSLDLGSGVAKLGSQFTGGVFA